MLAGNPWRASSSVHGDDDEKAERATAHDHPSCLVDLRHGRFDTLTASERGERMARIRSKDTEPELKVRRLVHGMGYRYRLHAHDLPGRPDLAFRLRRKAIFVHGCFWHRHEGCSRNRVPKSPERREYWRTKLDGNVQRDQRNIDALQRLGWRSLVIWECEVRDLDRIAEEVRRFLGPTCSDQTT
ncbi:MAG: very short patch repair endonuclease [Bryobacterales bacterium]|nr:very short patch repair endonuclease [Bryobacterales bacterium]